ncbi:MAG TPA: hypothetical protein DDX29_00605 [Clostridiales bacterium]|nr:hypothetical protein [Clostridiales bacterium]
MTKFHSLKQFLTEHGPLLVLIILFVVFIGYSSVLAVNLQPAVIPDEPAHFTFSKHFATTWGIPPDTYETYTWGWYIKQNPFLYHWSNGRLINVMQLITPEINDLQLLIGLRLINVLYASGTLLFLFMISVELIPDRWWQLLPVFLLSNTLMFVFLAAGVNYDNLANLLCMIGLYFFVRVYREHNFLTNSLAWMIFIGLATLVKYTILPLALAMSIAWLIYVILHRKSVFPINLSGARKILLTIIFLAVVLFNISIYGMNLILYQNILPPCQEILLESQCAISPFEKRYQEIAIKPKMTIQESIEEGYPGLIAYAFDTWVENMLLRTFGMIGHKSYFPLDLLMYFKILFYGTGILGLIFFRQKSLLKFSLVGIVLFYALVLLITNYNSELTYGFIHIALQGRYIFPVIGLIYVLFALIVKNLPSRGLRWIHLFYTLGLFLVGGPLTIILRYHSLFFSWLI